MIGYFDESGTHADPKVFTLAGFVAAEDAWAAFEPRWQAVLHSEGIKVFHMVDFAQRRGEFETGWKDENRRRSFLGRLLDVIIEARPHGFTFSVFIPDYGEVFASAVANAPDGDLLSEPYVFCLQGCMQAIAAKVESILLPSEKVSLIFDRNKAIAGMAKNAHDDLLIGREWDPIFYKGVDFKDKADFIPLQAADILAYESHVYWRNRSERNRRKPRFPLQRLISELKFKMNWHKAETLKLALLDMQLQGLPMDDPQRLAFVLDFLRARMR